MKKQFLLKLHSLAYWLHNHKMAMLAKVIDIVIRLVYTTTLPATTIIGQNVHFAHNGLAVILNPLSQIGDNCMIGSHVVLGGKYPISGSPYP